MVYEDKYLARPKVLTKGTEKDYKYVVVSRGIYPECYIQLPFKHKIARRNEYYINHHINLHGNASYYGVNANGQIPYIDIGHRVLGWSYSQLGDFVGYYKTYGYTPAVVMKEWKTEEIVNDIKRTVEQLEGMRYD